MDDILGSYAPYILASYGAVLIGLGALALLSFVGMRKSAQQADRLRAARRAAAPMGPGNPDGGGAAAEDGGASEAGGDTPAAREPRA